jgi:AraC family transcriptional regulator
MAEGWGNRMFGGETYGICHDFDEDGSFAYLCGAPALEPEADLVTVTLPKGRYARFDHSGHISSISDTWSAIFQSWQPSSGETLGEGPEFELYAADFDPEGQGRVAIFIPLA